MADQRHRRALYTVARHIAQSLRRDGEGVGGDGHRTQRGDDAGGDDLTAGHDRLLNGHGDAQPHRTLQLLRHEVELLIPPQTQHGGAQQAHAHDDRHHHLRQRCTQRSAGNA